MKMAKVTDFPPWWLHNYLSRISKRWRRHVQISDDTLLRASVHTWSNCYYKSKNKMRKLFNKYQNCQVKVDDWEPLVSYQVNNLHRRYDSIHLWGLREFVICDKANNEKFTRDIFPNLLWKHQTIKLSLAITDRIKLKMKSGRDKRYSWNRLISSSYAKFKNNTVGKLSAEVELWNLCYTANFYKIKDYWEHVSWNVDIHNNILKIERLRKYGFMPIQKSESDSR